MLARRIAALDLEYTRQQYRTALKSRDFDAMVFWARREMAAIAEVAIHNLREATNG